MKIYRDCFSGRLHVVGRMQVFDKRRLFEAIQEKEHRLDPLALTAVPLSLRLIDDMLEQAKTLDTSLALAPHPQLPKGRACVKIADRFAQFRPMRTRTNVTEITTN